jgi:hypothetical protein
MIAGTARGGPISTFRVASGERLFETPEAVVHALADAVEVGDRSCPRLERVQLAQGLPRALSVGVESRADHGELGLDETGLDLQGLLGG